MADKKYMKIALELAEKAKGMTSPNPMVGAVIVKDGEIVGQGYHRKAGTPHAETHALQEAGLQAQGAEMYVTLEPCSHHGRTPPCSQAVIRSGLSRVIIAMEDPNPLVAGRGIKQLREAGIEVKVGVLEEEAKRLNEVFVKYMTKQRPFILVKTAMTLDGKIAAESGDSRWVTGSEARNLVHCWRSWYDAILVGIGTVMEDNPLLTCRLENGVQKNPIRLVLDSRGRIPLDSAVLNTRSDAPIIVVTTEDMPFEKRKAIEDKGAEVLVLPSSDGRPDLAALVEELGSREISSLLVEGGAAVNASFFRAGLVDKVAWFIAPKIVGGLKAPGPVGEMGILKMGEALNLKNFAVRQIGADLLLEGYPE